MMPMTVGERARFDQADALAREASLALLASDFELAGALFLRAAAISPTAKQVLLGLASEAAAMGVSTEAQAARLRRAKSA